MEPSEVTSECLCVEISRVGSETKATRALRFSCLRGWGMLQHGPGISLDAVVIVAALRLRAGVVKLRWTLAETAWNRGPA